MIARDCHVRKQEGERGQGRLKEGEAPRRRSIIKGRDEDRKRRERGERKEKSEEEGRGEMPSLEERATRRDERKATESR